MYYYICSKIILLIFRMEEIFRLIAIFLFTTATIYFISINEYISATITMIAGVAYFGMYFDSMNHLDYRYADWSLTTPLILFALLTKAKFPLSQIIFLMVCDLLMIITGYLGKKEAEVPRRFMWFAVGMLVFIPILMALVKSMKTSSSVAMFTMMIWIAYPIVWVLGAYEDATKAYVQRIISPELENMITAVLDTTAKIGFGLLCRGCA